MPLAYHLHAQDIAPLCYHQGGMIAPILRVNVAKSYMSPYVVKPMCRQGLLECLAHV